MFGLSFNNAPHAKLFECWIYIQFFVFLIPILEENAVDGEEDEEHCKEYTWKLKYISLIGVHLCVFVRADIERQMKKESNKIKKDARFTLLSGSKKQMCNCVKRFFYVSLKIKKVQLQNSFCTLRIHITMAIECFKKCIHNFHIYVLS